MTQYLSIIANMDNDNTNKFEKDKFYILCHFILILCQFFFLECPSDFSLVGITSHFFSTTAENITSSVKHSPVVPKKSPHIEHIPLHDFLIFF